MGGQSRRSKCAWQMILAVTLGLIGALCLGFSLSAVPGNGLGVLHNLTSRDLPTDAGVPGGTTNRPGVQSGTWAHASVAYLGESHEVQVYLPASYPQYAPYPVVYLLHGHGMRLVLVAVEGDDSDIIASWYSRQAGLPLPDGPDWRVSFYDWFFEGVIPWVEEYYPVRSDPGGRAIAGFSMGGKGALSLAAHRPDLFCAAAAIAGVMDLRDYSSVFEIPDVYGRLAGSEIVYAADSPVELAPDLKGLSITLLHGDSDGLVNPEQSRKMHQALEGLGYTHLWEEIPGQDHEPVTTYEITRTFERVALALDTAYNLPSAWRYRFADDLVRQVYGATITKTDASTWTEVMSVTPLGFDAVSGDPFTLETAPIYAPSSVYTATFFDLGHSVTVTHQLITSQDGRLSIGIPAGRTRVSISAASLPEQILLPLILNRALAPAVLGCVAGLLGAPDWIP
jgi:S-formylglutathione hydrolase FrmB